MRMDGDAYQVALWPVVRWEEGGLRWHVRTAFFTVPKVQRKKCGIVPSPQVDTE
jgi:hypothetical protein